ncbi:MAG TPA: urea carboxylase, partial [Polyangiaceae bacterium]
FIGPTPEQMRAFGLKHTARALARANDVPLLPGSELLGDVQQALAEAARVGYPVMLKSTAGGGGIGMRRCNDGAELADAFEATARLARANFKESGLYLEKLLTHARHVEVQIFGDGRGGVVALGERDCSLQRRNQKVLEETPAPGLPETTRRDLCEAAVRLGQSVAYRSAGTVEFLVDGDSGRFYFLEVNTRIQVEHGITEEVTGIDLIAWMVELAAGRAPDLSAVPAPRGAAMQARLYAEDPQRGFAPCSGQISVASFPHDARIETWIEAGCQVTPFYDPMLAKIIVRGETRAEAREKLRAALTATRVAGIETNHEYLAQVVATDWFERAELSTAKLASFTYLPSTFEVLEPGTQTTVQDFPGRPALWQVGIPPSGPMDALSFRLGNRLVGNDASCAALECTLVGPTLRFNRAAVVVLTGADMQAEVDGRGVPCYAAVEVPAGSTLRLGSVRGAGSRAYLAVRGGIDVPPYLGSRATFTLGLFGGHAGRALQRGDVLHIARSGSATEAEPSALPEDLRPRLTNDWELSVLYGPHAAPDFFTPEDMQALFDARFKVHYNSSRTGVRLVGPRPAWARKDGGEAGLHPSNIHDTAYAVGTVDFTGDMPVILGPDGPSLGGFVCPVTIAEADLWKVGQLKAGDSVRFKELSFEEACERAAAQRAFVADLAPPRRSLPARGDDLGRAILLEREETSSAPSITVRQDGDANLLVEYGPMVLDLALRFRVHALMSWFEQQAFPGVLDLTPGIRSLQVHFDARRVRRRALLDAILQAEDALPAIDALVVPSRIVHLPLSWDDPATRIAIQKYTQSVRPDAPWCPSNIEFIRRINGLESEEDVRRIVFAASYLVLGLGDVYLGAPVATPIDPRHRLVTTKYNPARTWTPENAVGIGGAYLCVYGMEGPGGYQFVGRTCQMWNRHQPELASHRLGPEWERPWLLRFFDQIRFYPVNEQELLDFRDAFPRGQAKLRIEPTQFRLADYRAFLEANQGSIASFKQRQQRAFEAERERWSKLPPFEEPSGAEELAPEVEEIPPGSAAVRAEVTGSVWQLLVKPGDRVRQGDRLVILEAMKMETEVVAPCDGVVASVRCAPGTMVNAGTALLVLT